MASVCGTGVQSPTVHTLGQYIDWSQLKNCLQAHDFYDCVVYDETKLYIYINITIHYGGFISPAWKYLNVPDGFHIVLY